MTAVATRIVELIHAEKMAAGAHLPAQMLADRLRVSRSPVNEALEVLCEKGIVVRERHRGYFVARPITVSAMRSAGKLGLDENDAVTAAYFQIADDRLRGRLPDEFSEVLLKTRYQLTGAQLNSV